MANGVERGIDKALENMGDDVEWLLQDVPDDIASFLRERVDWNTLIRTAKGLGGNLLDARSAINQASADAVGQSLTGIEATLSFLPGVNPNEERFDEARSAVQPDRDVSRGGHQLADRGGIPSEGGGEGALESLTDVETGESVEEPRAQDPSGEEGDAPPGMNELAQNPPLGVGQGEQVARREETGQHPTKPRVRGTTDAVNVADQLYKQDDLTAPRGWDTQRVADLQRNLVASGLIEGVGELGMWKPQHEQAYRAALGMANRQGKTVDEIFTNLKADRQGQLQKEKERILEDNEFVAPEFSVDDESIKNQVERYFERIGGRAPTDAELERFASKLLSDKKSAHEAKVDKARAEWEHGMKQEFNSLFETERNLGLEYDNPFSDAKHPNEVEADAPDPEARLERELRNKMKPELEFDDARKARQQRDQGLIGSVRSLNQAIGRM